MKMMKDYHDLYLKCDVLLLADVLEKFKNNSLRIMDYVQCSTMFKLGPGLSCLK